MKSKVEIEEQREAIRKVLEKVIDESSEIDNVLTNEKHSRGIFHRSLKPHKGEYITHSDKGFMAMYRAEDGQLYEINVHKIGVPKN